MEIVNLPISEIKPYDNNPRKNAAGVAAVAKSMRQFGVRAPILVDKDHVIIYGHTRLEAAKENGLAEYPCVIATDMTPDEARAYRIADNHVATHSEWDPEKLKVELEALKPIEFKELPLIEMAPKEFFPNTVSFTTRDKDPDELPDPLKEAPRSRAGSLWTLGRHRLMCGDSSDLRNIEALVCGTIVDLVYTDPPYGIDIHGRSGFHDGKKHGSALAHHNSYNPVIGDEDLVAVKSVLPWCLDQKICVLWGANNYPAHLPPSNGWLVWNKEQHADFGDCELAYTNIDKSIRMFTHKWVGFMKDSERGEKRIHPTQKPVALAEWAFDLLKTGPTVVDLFGGSGSTLIACEKTERNCLMMEIDPQYCDLIVARWEKFTGQKAELTQ